jgi:hypothetical protein
MANGNNKNWNMRAFTSLTALAGFLIMGVSGIVAYVMPEGRVAYWTDWSMIGLSKEHWNDIHTMSGLLFVAAGILHTIYNWRFLMDYMRRKGSAAFALKRELAVTVVVSLLVLVSAVYQIPPLSYLLDLSARAKGSWVTSKEYEPPFGHAELLTLKIFARRMNIPLEKATAELQAKGFREVAPEKTLKDIAQASKKTPMAVYVAIRHLEEQAAVAMPATMTAEKVDEMFAGTGVGHKTLPEMAKLAGQEPSNLLDRLTRKGLSVQEDLPLKQLASKNNMQPMDLLKAALVEEYKVAQVTNK